MIQMPLACPKCGHVLSDEVGWCSFCRAGLREIEARMVFLLGTRQSDRLLGVVLALLPLILGIFRGEWFPFPTAMVTLGVLLVAFFLPHPYGTLRKAFAATLCLFLVPVSAFLLLVHEAALGLAGAALTVVVLLRAFWRRRP